MSRYIIPEENLAKLTAKLVPIRNKSVKYGCPFKFVVLGDVYKDFTIDGVTVTLKCKEVEAEGYARINGWEFVGIIEHTEAGNVIRNTTSYEVPDMYYTAPCRCDHCNTLRLRKDTYLVRDTDTGEFKQVGKNCLKDFTGGLDAELITYICTFISECETYSEPLCSLSSCNRYEAVEDILRVACEIIKLHGYVKTVNEECEPSTKDRVIGYLTNHVVSEKDKYIECESDYAKDLTSSVLEYFRNSSDSSEYMINVRTLLSNEYASWRDIGYIVSAVPSYLRYKKQEDERKQNLGSSEYYGTVGDKVTLTEVRSVRLVTSYETVYGLTYIFQIIDSCGNVFIWRTSKYIDTDKALAKIAGTIKSHEEYRGIKQTELTRCKFEYAS